MTVNTGAGTTFNNTNNSISFKMAKQQVITMSPAAHELLVAQIESLPHGMAKPLLLILKSNATPMNIEVQDAPQPTQPTEQEGGADE